MSYRPESAEVPEEAVKLTSGEPYSYCFGPVLGRQVAILRIEQIVAGFNSATPLNRFQRFSACPGIVEPAAIGSNFLFGGSGYRF